MAGRTTKYPGVYGYAKGGKTLFRCTWRDAAGHSRQKRGFTSPLSANTHRKEQVKLADGGVLTVAAKPRQTFAELYDDFITARRPYVSAGTLADYERAGRLRLKPHFDGQASKLTDRHVGEFMSTMAEHVHDGEIAPKTVNNTLIALVACLSWAVTAKRLPKNVALGTERLPVDEPERDYLRLKEIGVYLDNCSDTYRPLAELLIATGMRISEALGLRWDDIDRDGRTVKVYRQRRTATTTGPTKGRKFRRVEVGPDLLAVLRAMQARQGEWVEGDLSRATVFVSRGRSLTTGLGPMDRNTVSRDWHHDALEAAGLRSMPLHSLRHTAAASWLLAGQSLIYVQRQLGHSSYVITERVYSHLESASEAAAEVEALIRSAR